MTTITFEVPGDPKALKRHRTVSFNRRGEPLRFPRQYDPSQGDKADFLAKAMQFKPEKPLEGPLGLKTLFQFARPQSHYRTGKFSHELKPNPPCRHAGKPDIDNLFKFVADALNGIFWRDDKQIAVVVLGKYWGDKPGVYVEVTTL